MDDSVRLLPNGVEIIVTRDVVHPGTGTPGFDLMHFRAPSEDARDAFVRRCQSRFWAPWLVGYSDAYPAGLLYKPCDAAGPWEDNPGKPHSGMPRKRYGAHETGRQADKELAIVGATARDLKIG